MTYVLPCERCDEAGIDKPADYIYAGDPQHDAVRGRKLLCSEHFEILPEVLRIDYVPIIDGLSIEP